MRIWKPSMNARREIIYVCFEISVDLSFVLLSPVASFLAFILPLLMPLSIFYKNILHFKCYVLVGSFEINFQLEVIGIPTRSFEKLKIAFSYTKQHFNVVAVIEEVINFLTILFFSYYFVVIRLRGFSLMNLFHKSNYHKF